MGRTKKRIREYNTTIDKDKCLKALKGEIEPQSKPQPFFSKLLKSKMPNIDLKEAESLRTFAMLIGKGFSAKELKDKGMFSREEINPLQSTLTRNQLEKLLPYFNEYVFAEPIAIDELEAIFKGEVKNKTYRVKKNRAVAYTFDTLCYNSYVGDDWQQILEKMRLFESPKGKVLDKRDYSRAASSSKIDNKNGFKDADILKTYIKKIKKVDN